MLPACDTAFTAARLTLRVMAGRANLSERKSQLVTSVTEPSGREGSHVRRGHPRQETDEAGIRLGHAEERKVARAEARCRRRDDEADDADSERDYDVEVPLADLVAMCRDEEGADGRKEEGRGAEEEGRRVRVAERLGDLREAAGARASVTPPREDKSLTYNWLKERPTVTEVRARAIIQTGLRRSSALAARAHVAQSQRLRDLWNVTREMGRTLVVAERELGRVPVADLGRVVLHADVLSHALHGKLLLLL